uniref:Uncharacterized protein AlNc14C1107G12779 n=1 Tax=Albugo laibachii Nc14 TaxID=890382 RepID=F0X2I6_9STRA|nr:conserved hypothetical protein [Albugo laibachii Nc14]|eukprot:CCA28089.1 conserved hypothetical protein [Albugo laibachii Nc14]
MQKSNDKMSSEWKCLPLLRYSYPMGENAVWEVDPEAIRFLNSQENPLTQIIALTGTTAKNQLMRAIFRDHCSIVSSSGVALWLWKERKTKTKPSVRFWLTRQSPREKEDAKLLTEHDEMKVFTLLMLLSSVYIHQLDGVCTIQSFKKLLPWLEQLPESCKIRSKTQEPQHVLDDLGTQTPPFVFVCPNAKGKWRMRPDGQKYSYQEFLDQILMDEEGLDDEIVMRNTLRMYLKLIFPQHYLVGLSRMTEPKDDRLPSDENEDQLHSFRPQFLEELDDFCEHYLRKECILQKPGMGRPFQLGKGWSAMVSAYVDAMNRSKPLVIQEAIDAHTNVQVEEAFQVAKRQFYDQFFVILCQKSHARDDVSTDKVAEKSDINEAAILTSNREIMTLYHKVIQDTSIKTFLHVECSVLPDTQVLEAYREKWQAECFAELQKLLELNDHNSTSFCSKLIKSILPNDLEEMIKDIDTRKRESFCDGIMAVLSRFKSNIDQMLNTYKVEAIGPGRGEVLEQVITTVLFKSIVSMGRTMLRKYEAHLREMKCELGQVESDLAKVSMPALMDSSDGNGAGLAFNGDDQKRLYEAELEQATQQWTDVRSLLRSELETKKGCLENLQLEMQTMNKKHELRVDNLEQELRLERSRLDEVQKKAQEDRREANLHVQGVSEQVLDKERGFYVEERAILDQQQELLSRIVQLERELVQKKTEHMQAMFDLETQHVNDAEALKQEHVEFSRQLKTQGRTDSNVLRQAYQKRKANLRKDVGDIDREMCHLEDKLRLLATGSRPDRERASTANRRLLNQTNVSTESPGAVDVVEGLKDSETTSASGFDICRPS